MFAMLQKTKVEKILPSLYKISTKQKTSTQQAKTIPKMTTSQTHTFLPCDYKLLHKTHSNTKENMVTQIKKKRLIAPSGEFYPTQTTGKGKLLFDCETT